MLVMNCTTLKNIRNERGMVLLPTLACAVIVWFAAYYLLQSTSSSLNLSVGLQKKFIARQFASELLEYFRGLSTNDLVDYFANPSRANYQLCAHINLLDRAVTQQQVPPAPFIYNPDSTAALPLNTTSVSRLQPLADPWSLANRFYVVQVIDVQTGIVDQTKCNLAISTLRTALSPMQRFLVTVGVSWETRDMLPSETVEIRQVSLATILPRNEN